MRIIKYISLFIILGGWSVMLSNAQEAGTKARLAHSHWECLLYLDFAGSEETYRNYREKHFLAGIKHVREMMAELKNTEIKIIKTGRKQPQLFLIGTYLGQMKTLLRVDFFRQRIRML